MKIVFIAHYFPPLNSSGARRINAFAKYLSSWGHEITVITTRKTERDGLLTEAVPGYLRLVEIDNLGRLSPTVVPVSSEAKAKFGVETRSGLGRFLLKIKRAVMKVSGQLIDHRLLFAIQFASPLLAPEAKSVLKEADVVMSSCPPWPTHLAGWFIKKRFGKPWIADYRDQFSGNHLLRGSAISRFIEVQIERWLLRTADCVTAISGPMQEYYGQFHPRVYCIENGYDEGVFADALSNATAPDQADSKELVIRYMGSITPDRIPKAFLGALARLNRQPGKSIVVEFYGESTLLRKALPEVVPEAVPYVRFFPQLSYVEAIRRTLSADALFFVETSDFSSHSARGVLTTKLFEYMAARKPVVAEISPKSLAAQYIGRSGLGVVVTQDIEEMTHGLAQLREGGFHGTPDAQFIESLSRRVKAQQLEKLLIEKIPTATKSR